MTREPPVATTPFHDQLPLAVQDVAFVLDQVIVELAPEEIVEGLNEMTTVGVRVSAFTLPVPAAIPPIARRRNDRIAHHIRTLACPIAARRRNRATIRVFIRRMLDSTPNRLQGSDSVRKVSV